MNESEIIALLESINADNPAHMVPQPWRSFRGESGVHTRWRQVFAGNVRFAIPGYYIEVFNDCNSWDYIEYVIGSDGTRFAVDLESDLFNWCPRTDYQRAGWSNAWAP